MIHTVGTLSMDHGADRITTHLTIHTTLIIRVIITQPMRIHIMADTGTLDTAHTVKEVRTDTDFVTMMV